MFPYRPKLILVQEPAWRDPETQEILARLPGIEIGTIQEVNAEPQSRDTLILMHYPGTFLKQCQGAGAEMCCNYFVASYAWNCHFDCTYCVLQSYLTNEALIVCTNIDDLLVEIKEKLRQHPDQTFRIGTGELADSLALDAITAYSKRMVPFFASLPNGILELKTKSNQIDNLKDLNHAGHTVISWSLNSRCISSSEEHKAATIDERLAAAVQCQSWGYKLGFHFDPIVYYPDWEDDYKKIVKELFAAINPENVAWISLGALRFTPHLRDFVRSRYPASKIPYGEFFPGHHGKLRYFRPIREKIYRKMKSWIQEEASQVLVYICMESRLVWQNSFGDAPCDAMQLSDLLDEAVCPHHKNCR
jgi:spore photoproduct lyase